jgi:RNA polymerase sigma-70 factor (ECF subfamily)
MLLHGAREALYDGDLVLLDDQDRSLWDAAQIADGRAVLDRALALRRGPYVLQAAIASLHADEPRDWPQIAALRSELVRLTRSPVVELNRAVAVAEAGGPEEELAIVDRLDLDDYRWHARPAPSCCAGSIASKRRGAYQRALELAHAAPSAAFLERRLGQLG